jgi:hypothetical protein
MLLRIFLAKEAAHQAGFAGSRSANENDPGNSIDAALATGGFVCYRKSSHFEVLFKIRLFMNRSSCTRMKNGYQ